MSAKKSSYTAADLHAAIANCREVKCIITARELHRSNKPFGLDPADHHICPIIYDALANMHNRRGITAKHMVQLLRELRQGYFAATRNATYLHIIPCDMRRQIERSLHRRVTITKPGHVTQTMLFLGTEYAHTPAPSSMTYGRSSCKVTWKRDTVPDRRIEYYPDGSGMEFTGASPWATVHYVSPHSDNMRATCKSTQHCDAYTDHVSDVNTAIHAKQYGLNLPNVRHGYFNQVKFV